MEAKIKEFYTQVDEYRTKIDTTGTDAEKTVQSNRTATETLISKLKELEDQIKSQIQKATGFSLFHSFQTRQISLARSKRLWALALFCLVVASISLTFYVVHYTTEFDKAFYMKLSFSLPIIYAIAFCTVQYSRERKLEEEYAFKSNISISLIPYQELVDKLVDKEQAEERHKYTAFIIDSISKVFASPTDKVFETGEKKVGISDKTIKQIATLIEPIVKGLKH